MASGGIPAKGGQAPLTPLPLRQNSDKIKKHFVIKEITKNVWKIDQKSGLGFLF